MRLLIDQCLYYYAIGLVLILALIIVAAPAPYFHDFGEWVYQGQILAEKVTNPSAVTNFVVAPYPVPNELAPMLLALASLFLNPIIAGKIFLILLLIGWIWVLWRFSHQFVPDDSRGAALVLLVAVVALSSFFWYGFVGYQLGLLLFLTFLTIFANRSSMIWIAIFGIALFFSHAMIFLAWGMLVILQALASRPPHWRTLLALAPAGMLSVGFILGRHLTGFDVPVTDANMSGFTEIVLYKFGYPLLLGGFRNLLLPDGISLLENHAWLYWLGAASNAMIVFLLGIFILLVMLKPGAGRACFGELSSRLPNGVLRGFGLVVIAAYLIMPYHFFGLINPGGRLLLPLLVVSLMLADRNAFRWVRLAAMPAALGAILSVGAYGILMYRAATEGSFFDAKTVASENSPDNSVFAFNNWLYRNTRYKYLNYRIFAFAERFDQIVAHQYPGLAFRTGPLTDYHARP